MFHFSLYSVKAMLLVIDCKNKLVSINWSREKSILIKAKEQISKEKEPFSIQDGANLEAILVSTHKYTVYMRLVK